MRANEVVGLVFANVHDDNISNLTGPRAMASVLFGGRYRLIDFSLSNLVNSGISKVGIITESNYQSLMDHVGAGKPWDLDRKSGGLYILPPYMAKGVGKFRGSLEALEGALTFLKRCKEKYVVMCNADVVSSINIENVVDFHIENDADITVCYKNGVMPKNDRDVLSLKVADGGKVTSVQLEDAGVENTDFSLGVFVISTELLISIITEARKHNMHDFSRDVILGGFDKFKVCGYKIDSYAEVIDSPYNYVKANMMLLNSDVRHNLFNRKRPVFTKSRDNMPTRYGINSKVENSIIGEGCVINGTVKNCVIFRNVNVADGAVLENCIIMQGSDIGENAKCRYVVADKNTKIADGTEIAGAETYYSFIKKNAEI